MSANHHRMSKADEIAAAAARLIGTPEQIAKRLRALLDEGAPPAAARESAAARREREAETEAHERAVAAHRHRLAADFAEARGWRATAAPLAVKELARRGYPGGNWHKPSREWLGTMFHPTFYRDASRRAAAMVAHPLAEQVERDQEGIVTWAAERDLTVTFSEEPSWQDPGRAVVVIFEPAEPATAPTAARRTAPPLPASTDPVELASTPLPAPPTAPDLATLQPLELLGPADAEPSRAGQETAPDPVEDTDVTQPAPPLTMRPIVPIDLAGIVPRDLSDEIGPDFDIVAPAELLVDETYQRNLGPKSIDLIRRIVGGWSWSKFKPPICTRVGGALHVIDGQHTAIGAASHGGIPVIPVVVVPVPEVADRAAAFVSHAKDRLQATALQVHRAALVAGDEEAVTLDAVCRRAGVELLPFAPSDARYAPRQTVAVVGLRRLIAKRGAERAAEVLAALAGADLAPITGDHIRLGEVLLCDPAYADTFDADRLTAAMRGLTAKTQAEARELAIAQRLSAWRALAAVLARNSRAATARRRPAA